MVISTYLSVFRERWRVCSSIRLFFRFDQRSDLVGVILSVVIIMIKVAKNYFIFFEIGHLVSWESRLYFGLSICFMCTQAG